MRPASATTGTANTGRMMRSPPRSARRGAGQTAGGEAAAEHEASGTRPAAPITKIGSTSSEKQHVEDRLHGVAAHQIAAAGREHREQQDPTPAWNAPPKTPIAKNKARAGGGPARFRGLETGGGRRAA